MKSHRTLFRAALAGSVALAAAGQYACRDAPTAPSEAARTHIAQSINTPGDSGAPETVFLAPLGPKLHPRGELDTTLAPSVAICRLSGDACGTDTVARFSAAPATDSAHLIQMTERAYRLRWSTGDLPADSAIAYRIIVTLGDTTVGYTDLKIVAPELSPSPDDTARFAYITGRNALVVRFQVFVPRVTLTVISEPGVTGDLTSRTYTFRKGERVEYGFTADSGYSNALVTLDQSPIPRRGRITMDDSHVLIASADRNISISPGDEWILRDARALLTAADKVKSAQHLLDRLDEMTDTTDLADRLRRVELTLLKRGADASAMPALDAALDGHTLDAGDGDGSRIDPPATGGGGGGGAPPIAASRLAPHASPLPLRAAALRAAPTEDGAEPLTIAYVNGILTTPLGALFAAHHVARAARSARWNANVPFDVKLIYNRSAMAGETSAEDRCVLGLGISGDWLGLNSLPAELAKCLDSTEPRALAMLADYAEAGQQLANVLAHTSTGVHPADADTVAAFAARMRDQGRHIVFVMHSQGNLVVQQALSLLGARGQYAQARDSTCIGGVALAAPTSEAWPISARHLHGLAVKGDIILALGHNHFPLVHTAMSDSADHATSGSLRNRIMGLATAASVRWGVKLHSAVTSYLTPEPIRTRVQEAIVSSYRGCALGTIGVAPQQMELTTGATGTFRTSLTDMDGEPLDGQRGVTWRAESQTDVQQAVQLTPDGTATARYVGGTSVHALTRSVSANAGVTVSAAQMEVTAREALSAKWIVVFMGESPTYPAPPFVIPKVGWDGGSCTEKATITSNGRTGTFSKQCYADYRVVTDPFAGAAKYTAAFFEKGATSALYSVSGAHPPVRGSTGGPEATLDMLPGPTVFDRIVLSAYDKPGHLLAQGIACVHGCVGWPPM